MSPDALLPSARLPGSQRKIRAPFVLDPSLCLYSPQSNVDALSHPRVAGWLEKVQHHWEPTPVPGADRGRLALLLPCTKYKPYPTSREHRAVNAALQAAGWRPATAYDGPAELLDVLDGDEHPDLLATAPLVRDGVVLDRFVISEPLALVPYELTLYADGEQSPATSYDDPGLFVARGTSVSPERSDCTARPRPDGSWAWGPAEREAYVVMHNAMAAALTTALTRLAPHYGRMFAWVSPGLTHRSFLADDALRLAEGMSRTRRGTSGVLALRGVLDEAPGLLDVMPDEKQIHAAREALAQRLEDEGRPHGEASVRAVFARGDGHDTPLGLPELAALLVGRLDEEAEALGAVG